jgi:glycine/D-amino acid oxidase-like deaminating enzyme
MWTINTPRGSIVAPNVLLATNGYTAHLLPDEFRSLIVPVQGEMSALTPPASMLKKPLEYDYSFVGKEQDDYLVQRPVEVGGQFMFGGGRRVAARRGVGVSDDSTCDGKAAKYLRTMVPRVMDLELPRDEVAKAQASAPEGWEYAEVLKGDAEKNLDVEAEWTGIMGFSRDGCPWVGSVPSREGLWVCAGYTGHGKGALCPSRVIKRGIIELIPIRNAKCKLISDACGATHRSCKQRNGLARSRKLCYSS